MNTEIENQFELTRLNIKAFINNKCRDLDLKTENKILQLEAKITKKINAQERQINPFKFFVFDMMKKGINWLINNIRF